MVLIGNNLIFKNEPRQNKSLAEAKRDILPALTQLSLGRLLLSRACLRFTGRFKFNRSIGQIESKHEHDILFALTCLLKPARWIVHPLILL